jgi:hypothetical protein
MHTRRLIWLLPALLALVGAPGSALAETHRPTNPNPLWRAYPLGTQLLAKSTGPGSARGGQHSKPGPRSAAQNTFRVGFTQILVGTAVLCTFAALIPTAVRRRRSSSRRIAARVNRGRTSPPRDSTPASLEWGAAKARRQQVARAARSPSATSQPVALAGRRPDSAHPIASPRRLRFAGEDLSESAALTSRRPDATHAPASPRRLRFAEEDLRLADSPATSREESIGADLPAIPDMVEARPARSTRPRARPDEAILHYAAAYADASQRGAPVPMAAVRAIVSPLTHDPAGYAKRMIAEARRRDLLTSHGRGRAGGELTPRALELMNRSTTNRTHPARSRGEGDEAR